MTQKLGRPNLFDLGRKASYDIFKDSQTYQEFKGRVGLKLIELNSDSIMSERGILQLTEKISLWTWTVYGKLSVTEVNSTDAQLERKASMGRLLAALNAKSEKLTPKAKAFNSVWRAVEDAGYALVSYQMSTFEGINPRDVSDSAWVVSQRSWLTLRPEEDWASIDEGQTKVNWWQLKTTRLIRDENYKFKNVDVTL